MAIVGQRLQRVARRPLWREIGLHFRRCTVARKRRALAGRPASAPYTVHVMTYVLGCPGSWGSHVMQPLPCDPVASC